MILCVNDIQQLSVDVKYLVGLASFQRGGNRDGVLGRVRINHQLGILVIWDVHNFNEIELRAVCRGLEIADMKLDDFTGRGKRVRI